MLKPEDFKVGLLIKFDETQQVVKQFTCNTYSHGNEFKNQIAEVLSIKISTFFVHGTLWNLWWPGLNKENNFECKYFNLANEQ